MINASSHHHLYNFLVSSFFLLCVPVFVSPNALSLRTSIYALANIPQLRILHAFTSFKKIICCRKAIIS